MIKKVISAVTAVTNPHYPIYPPKLQNQKTEYIKCKMNVAELFENLFLLESQQTSISDDGKIDSTDASKILEHYANISIGGTGTL